LFSRKDINAPVTFLDVVIGYSLVITAFILIYYSAEFHARDSEVIYNAYFSWELNIPFLAIGFIPYFGIFLLPFFIPFTIRQSQPYYQLIFKLIVAIGVAGLCFYFFPTQAGFPPKPLSSDVDAVIVAITGNHNLVPSLHVCLTWIICMSIYPFVNTGSQLFLKIIMVILPLSTLITHQHHVIDIISGMLLAIFIEILFRYISKPKRS